MRVAAFFCQLQGYTQASEFAEALLGGLDAYSKARREDGGSGDRPGLYTICQVGGQNQNVNLHFPRFSISVPKL